MTTLIVLYFYGKIQVDHKNADVFPKREFILDILKNLPFAAQIRPQISHRI